MEEDNQTFYSVEYTDYNDITLVSVQPPSDYVETLFYNGELLREVHLNDSGKFRLDFWLDSETGEVVYEGKFKYYGWIEVTV